MRALVVFFDPERPRFARLLKPGFRHVFACIDDGNHWIMLDGRNGQSVIQAIQASDYDLKEFFEAQGYRVIEVTQGPPLRMPLVATSCVGLVKAVLCIRSFAQTPYQLYRHLGGQP